MSKIKKNTFIDDLTTPSPSEKELRKEAKDAVNAAVDAHVSLLGVSKKLEDPMYAARGRVVFACRQDPLLQPETLSKMQLASIAREPRVAEWCDRYDWFKKWLSTPAINEENMEAVFSKMVDHVNARLSFMADKDVINAMKLISELTGRLIKAAPKEKILDKDIAGKSQEMLQEMLISNLRQIGYQITPPEDKKDG